MLSSRLLFILHPVLVLPYRCLPCHAVIRVYCYSFHPYHPRHPSHLCYLVTCVTLVSYSTLVTFVHLVPRPRTFLLLLPVSALHVIVAIAMLLRAMTPKISSACARSPPFSQALTAALHVIVSIWMLLRAMTPKTSSARGHSRPFLQALMCPLTTFFCKH